MKKKEIKTGPNGEFVTDGPPSNYKPKGPKTTVTAILANQLRALPFEERAKFIEGLGRIKRGGKQSGKTDT